MRFVTYGLTALMIFALLGGLAYQKHRDRHLEASVRGLQHMILELQRQALYHASIKDVGATPRGFAEILKSEWAPAPGHNPLLEGARAWVDIAGKEDAERMNPRHIADLPGVGGIQAEFWYNPYSGVVRARVPMQISLQATVALYNRVNGTRLSVNHVMWEPRSVLGAAQDEEDGADEGE